MYIYLMERCKVKTFSCAFSFLHFEVVVAAAAAAAAAVNRQSQRDAFAPLR